MEMVRPNVIGDFDLIRTFLPWDPSGGHFTITSFSVNKEGNGVKIVFTFKNEATNTCTKLYVNPVHRTDLGNKNQITYNCEVASFSTDENKTIGFYHGIPFPAFYREILVDIDPYLIMHDKAYFECLMTDVLNVDRIDRYLAEGAKESPSQPCGNYIGGATYYKGNGIPQKVFNPEVGWHAHLLYGEELIERRKRKLLKEIQELKDDNNKAGERIKQRNAENEKDNATIERNNPLIVKKMEELKSLEYNSENLVSEQNVSSNIK